MDPWQAALEDVGPAGVDKGKGGKYLILPPGYHGTVPDGYIALPSANYQGYALLRSILKSGSDADVANGRRLWQADQALSASQAANPPATIFVDAIDVVYDSTIPYDLRFFQSLDRFVQQRALAGARQGDDRPCSSRSASRRASRSIPTRRHRTS